MKGVSLPYIIIATFNFNRKIVSGKPKSYIAMTYYTSFSSSAYEITSVAPLLRDNTIPAKYARKDVLGMLYKDAAPLIEHPLS